MNRLILPIGLVAAILFVGPPSYADQEAELLRAQADYVLAREAEKKAAEEASKAEQAATELEKQVAAQAKSEVAKVADIERRKATAERELLGIMERRKEIEAGVAVARGLSIEARKAYDQARPIYEIIGRTQQLSDYPEWKTIERNASDTNQAARKAIEDAAPKFKAADEEIEAKRRQILAIQEEYGQPLGGPDSLIMLSWLEAALKLGQANQKHAKAQRELTEAFDAYMAKLGPARPPFLESVTAEIGSSRIYTGIWRPKPDTDGDSEARIAELRDARDKIWATIVDREHRAETMRKERLELAESMHANALRYVEAEERLTDARLKKIGFAALAEVAGTVVEAVLTGGVATAVRKATEVTEQKVTEAAAKRLLATSAPLLDQSTEATARLMRRSEEAFARKVHTAYAEAQRQAVEAAFQRVKKTGEVLDIATIDAKRQLARALQGLAETDPIVRAEALRQARHLMRDKDLILLEPIIQAYAGKRGGNKLADVWHGDGASGDPIERLAAADAKSATNNRIADVKGVVMGDFYEQIIARSVSFTMSAGRVGLEGARAAALENAGRWQQIAAGSREFLRGGVTLKNFGEAFGGTMKGNLVGLVTTGAKAIVTNYYGALEQMAGLQAYELYGKLELDQKLLDKALEGGKALHDELVEARRVYAELQVYLALLGRPRELDVRDDVLSMEATGDLKLRLSFSAPLDRAPQASLAGKALSLQAEGKDAQGGATVWTVTVPRAELSADAAAELVVDVVGGTKPFDKLDANPATPARPDPRAEASAAARELKWLDLESGGDKNHKIALRDPWTGIWSRGETRIRITRDRLSLTGVIETPSAVSRGERGFSAGQKVMQGDIGTDRTAQLEWLARYDRSWREKCPARADGYWSRGAYKLDPAGTLSGTWQNQELEEGCVVAATTQGQDTLKREAGR